MVNGQLAIGNCQWAGSKAKEKPVSTKKQAFLYIPTLCRAIIILL